MESKKSQHEEEEEKVQQNNPKQYENEISQSLAALDQENINLDANNLPTIDNPYYEGPTKQIANQSGLKSGEQGQGLTANTRDPSYKRNELYLNKLKDYRFVSELGKGGYGIVDLVQDRKTKLYYAIKFYFQQDDDDRGIDHCTLREFVILKKLSQYNNFVKLIEIVKGTEGANVQYAAVFDYYETDLKKYIRKQRQIGKKITHEQIKDFMFQLICGVHIMHGSQYFHRDLKPMNIMMTGKNELKIGDFGLAKKDIITSVEKSNTIMTIWYRAPEIFLGHEAYLYEIDIWALGCIFAELINGDPFFKTASGAEREVFSKICKIFGTPTIEALPDFFKMPQADDFLKYAPKHTAKNLAFYLKDFEDQKGIDLLQKMLVMDPDARISTSKALTHPYFDDCKDKLEQYGVDPKSLEEFREDCNVSSCSQLFEELSLTS